MNEDNKETKWKCTVCGYIYDGDPLPSHFSCPVCGSPRPKFEREEKVYDDKKA